MTLQEFVDKYNGKKVTLSFYARGGAEFVSDNATLVSKIVTGKGTDQKVLSFTTSADAISQNNTLTTGWVKFTCTTTNVIASDITQIGVSFSFTHAGSGTTTNYFEVTQVQLCAGDVALPFQPKSFDDELRACQRYYEKSFDYSVAPATGADSSGSAGYRVHTAGANAYMFSLRYTVPKRTDPTVTYYNIVSANAKWYNQTLAADSGTASTDSDSNEFMLKIANPQVAGDGAINACKVHWTAEAEL